MPEIPEEKRRTVFRRLVELQAQGLSPAESRSDVAARFRMTVADVLIVEKEGIREQWPPLVE